MLISQMKHKDRLRKVKTRFEVEEKEKDRLGQEAVYFKRGIAVFKRNCRKIRYCCFCKS